MVTDIAVGPEGQLFVLSDSSRLIAHLEENLRPTEDKARFTAAWKLPADLDKPEGLALAPDGRVVVAIDSSRATDNAFVLEPLD